MSDIAENGWRKSPPILYSLLAGCLFPVANRALTPAFALSLTLTLALALTLTLALTLVLAVTLALALALISLVPVPGLLLFLLRAVARLISQLIATLGPGLLLRSTLNSLVRHILCKRGATKHQAKTEQNYGGTLID
jgi:hypothetical protein